MVNGIGEKNREEIIEVYPNPASEWVYFKSISNVTISSIAVFNSEGKQVTLVGSQNQMDISNFPEGVYIFKINLSNVKESVHRIIKK